MGVVFENLRDLSDGLVYLCTNCNGEDYPTEFETYDEAWKNLGRNLEHLRRKLGDARYAQLVDMAAQAKAHYDAGYALGGGGRNKPGAPGSEEIRRGSRLMQDMEQVVKGKPPFAYPKELYRWPTGEKARAR